MQDFNTENVIIGFKNFLGKQFNDVTSDLRKLKHKFELLENEHGGISILVDYLQEKIQLFPEQVVAMLFTKIIQEIKDENADFILTVPSHFTSFQRQALLDAASIANLNCLQLINETTAIAINYGYYKQDNFSDQSPRNVCFLDFGDTSLQVSIVAFTKGKIQVLATTSTMVGGCDLSQQICNYFCDEIQRKFFIDPKNDKKSWKRLLTEADKLKKMMSTNSTNLRLKLDDFMSIAKVELTICRKQMESICEEQFIDLKKAIERCIEDSKVDDRDIHSIEITGGSSRIPEFHSLVAEIFGKAPSTTLNQDEAVSRGGAIYCAMKSKFVTLKHEIVVHDVLAHNPIQIIFKYISDDITHIETLFDDIIEYPIKRTIVRPLIDKKMPGEISLTSGLDQNNIGTWKCKEFSYNIEV